MGSFRSAALLTKSKAGKKQISSSNVLHVVQRPEFQKFIMWIACKKPNLGFLANLNPLLKLCAGSSNWGFLKLQLSFCVVCCYLCFTYVFYVFILSSLASKLQCKIMINFIFMENLSFAYVVIVFMGFLTHSWLIIPLFQTLLG